ncbi:hypothetical protein SH449x_004389 [Pirellulaceae bacterium SH449]
MLNRTRVVFVTLVLLTPFVKDVGPFVSTSQAQDEMRGMPLVFADDFESGRGKWVTTDDASWDLVEADGNHTFSINKRVSDYTPKHRSPHNIAWIKDLELASFAIKFRVRSTLDTGNHRDCCVFFAKQNADQFYYVHLGAKPDPASGQIMIVNNAPRSPLTTNEKPVPWDDKWHEVMIVRDAKSGLIEVFFDDMDEPLMQCKDTTFQKGGIGLGSFDDRNEFDDVRIYSADLTSKD